MPQSPNLKKINDRMRTLAESRIAEGIEVAYWTRVLARIDASEGNDK